MDANKVTTISKADSIETIGDFWDTHDFTDFDSDRPDVEFGVSSKVAIDAELLSSVEQVARRRGVGVETLVNLWLSEKVLQQEGINPYQPGPDVRPGGRRPIPGCLP